METQDLPRSPPVSGKGLLSSAKASPDDVASLPAEPQKVSFSAVRLSDGEDASSALCRNSLAELLESPQFFPLNSMLDESALLQLRAETTEHLRAAEEELLRQRSEINECFESFDEMSFTQKFIRRNSQTKRRIRSTIFSKSKEMMELHGGISYLKKQLARIDLELESASLNAKLKRNFQQWIASLGSAASSSIENNRCSVENDITRLKMCRAYHMFFVTRRVLIGGSGSIDKTSHHCRRVNHFSSLLVYCVQSLALLDLSLAPKAHIGAEVSRISALSDNAYASEMFLMAGVNNWTVSEDEVRRETSRCKRMLQSSRCHGPKRSDVLSEVEGEKESMRRTLLSKGEDNISFALLWTPPLLVDLIISCSLNLALQKSSLDNKWVNFNGLSIPQKYVRRNSKTKARLCQEIETSLNHVKCISGTIAKYRRQLRTVLDAIELGASMKAETMIKVRRPRIFRLDDFEFLISKMDSKSEYVSDSGTPVLISRTELRTRISKYEEAVMGARMAEQELDINKNDFSTLPKLEQKVRSTLAILKIAQDKLMDIPDYFISSLKHDAALADLERAKLVRQDRVKALIIAKQAHDGSYTDAVSAANDANMNAIRCARRCQELSIRSLRSSEKECEILRLESTSPAEYAAVVIALSGSSSLSVSDQEQLDVCEKCRLEDDMPLVLDDDDPADEASAKIEI
jgi:hypothetical protein